MLSAPTALYAQQRPMIEHIAPTSGPPGTTVRIVGRGLSRSYRVLFNEQPVTPTEFLPERITVTVPEHATTGRFVLSNGSDEVETEVFRVSAQEPAPVITALEPPNAAPGGEIVVRGEHFSVRPSDNTVRVGNVAMVVRNAEPTALRVIVPEGATSGPVTVRTQGGEGRSPAELTVGTRLIIREFVPAAVTPGGRVTLRGAGFSTGATANRVTVNGRPVRVGRVTPTELEITVPLDAQSGTVAIEVAGVGRYETATRLMVGPAPTIASFEPAQGAEGARVTLRGTNFGTRPQDVQLTLGGTALTVNSVSPTEIVATLPHGVGSGRLGLTANGIGPVESATEFTVLAPVAVARMEPRAGDVGDRVTLTGTGFSTTAAQNTVTLGTVPARVLEARGTELVVEVPNARSGLWYVNVTGNGTAHTRDPFMVTQRPRITAIDPPAGIPGSHVTLRGTNFPADRTLAQVRLNGVDVPIVSYSPDAIEVTVPRDAQNGRFQVIGRLQGSGQAPVDFNVLSPVTLREVVPPAGPVGTSVTLRGEGFEPDPARFTLRLGTLTLRPTRASTTEIVFTVPRTARDGVLTVESEGRQPVSSPAPFAITVPPVVTGFLPLHAAAGTHLIVRGRNFGTVVGNVGITLGHIACPVASVTPTTIDCVVPEQAESGVLSVRVANAGEVHARAPFRFDAPAPATPHP